ncbi:MAG: hypothetical protein AAFQ37_09590 [Bacteroidota bacterium]
MSAWIHISELERLHAEFSSTLSKMKSRLDRFAEKPNANPDYINDLRMELVVLARYQKLSSDTLTQVLQDSRNTYRRGYADAIKKQDQQNTMTYVRWEKGNEYARRLSKTYALEKWPELY